MNQRLRFLQAASGLFLLLIASVTSIVYARPEISPQAVVSSWSTKNIGAVSRKGGLVSSGDVLKVKGSGRDIGGTNDQFCYAYTSLSGDGQLVAYLISQDATDNAAKAGLMLRETLADNAPNVFLMLTPHSGIALQWRGTSGATTHSISGPHGKVPRWMKLIRQNNIVTGWTSYDGLRWMKVTSVTIKMPATVSIGFAVTSHNENRLSQAVFMHVIFTKKPISPTPTPVPPTPTPVPPTPTPVVPVSDSATRVYGQAGSFFTNSVNINAITLNTPDGVTIDSSGNLYIADAQNNRVLYYPVGSTAATRVYGQGGNFSTNDGIVSANGLNAPDGMAIDSNGDLYIADEGNNRVLYYPVGSTTATRVYGQGGSFTASDGTVSATGLNTPGGIALDSSGNLYVADTINNRVLYYAAGSTTATRVYGQNGSFTTNVNSTSASGLNAPDGVSLDSNNNLYIADAGNNRVLYYPVGSTTATRVYGQADSFTSDTVNNGGVGDTSLQLPSGVALDSNGNLSIADSGNNRVLYYPAGSTTATQVYGQGGSFFTNTFNVSINSLNAPFGVVTDESGNLYVADSGNNRVLYYPAGSTRATRVYGQRSFATNTGNNGGISASSLNIPSGVALDSNGNLYIADSGNNRVLYYPAGSTTATRVYGQMGDFSSNSDNNGIVSATSLNSPNGVLVDDSGNLYVADTINNRVLYYPSGSTRATRVYGQGGSFTANDHNHGGVSASSINYPNGGMALDRSGNLYIADSANSRVLYYPAGSTTATRVYGQASFTTKDTNTGGVSATTFTYPSGIALDSSGSLYVADIFNNRVLYYPVGSTRATQVYGQGGSFTTNTVNKGGVSAGSLNTPLGVAIDKNGDLYVADATNNRVLVFPHT